MTRGARLGGFLGLAFALTVLGYGSRLGGGRPDRNIAYEWNAAIGGAIEYALILTVVLLLSRDAPRQILALRRPRSWPVAGGIAVCVAVVLFVLEQALAPLHPDREQGLTPTRWEPSHAAQYGAYFLVVAGFAPVVEELTFRGLGFYVLRPFGTAIAVLGVGLAFGLAHGLVYALPLLVVFGTGLAYLRARTESVYPGIAFHSFFNALALVLAVTT